MSEKCVWKIEEWDWGTWESDCEYYWQVENGKTPKENGMNYCPKCGRELVEELEECLET